MRDAIKRIAKDKLARGINPLAVHEWLMRAGASIEEADAMTGCRTTTGESKPAKGEDKYEGPTKRLVIIKGKGTKREQRIETDITMYWVPALKRYVTIPE